MFSIPPYSLEATSLQRAPTVGTVGRAYIPKMGVGHEEPPIAWVQLTGQLAATSSQ